MTQDLTNSRAESQPLPEPKRQAALLVPECLEQFTSRLTTHAAWMQQFLHGAK